MQTVPATRGARVAAEGEVASTDSKGVARLPVQNFGSSGRRLHVPRDAPAPRPQGRASTGSSGAVTGQRVLTVGLRTSGSSTGTSSTGAARSPSSRVVPARDAEQHRRVVRFRGRSSRAALDGGRPHPADAGSGCHKELYWSVSRVVVDGGEVVNRASRSSFPSRPGVDGQLLFYRVQFGRGRAVRLVRRAARRLAPPDGTRAERRRSSNGKATLPSLPAGLRRCASTAPGPRSRRPVRISKDQMLEHRGDLALRPRRDRRPARARSPCRLPDRRPSPPDLPSSSPRGWRGRRRRSHGRRSRRWQRWRSSPSSSLARHGVLTARSAGACCSRRRRVRRRGPARRRRSARASPTTTSGTNPTSWQRAKKDYPLLGRYSSDDPVGDAPARRRWRRPPASPASSSPGRAPTTSTRGSTRWCGSPQRQDFKLEIVYQGLDFQRNPLPVPQIAEDLRVLRDRYAGQPGFRHLLEAGGGRSRAPSSSPSPSSGASPTAVRGRLLVLASAKNVEEYRRTAVGDGRGRLLLVVERPALSRCTRRKLEQMSRGRAHGRRAVVRSRPGRLRRAPDRRARRSCPRNGRRRRCAGRSRSRGARHPTPSR